LAEKSDVGTLRATLRVQQNSDFLDKIKYQSLCRQKRSPTPFSLDHNGHELPGLRLTFGGCWLIEGIRNFLPEFDRYVYKG
jgi:hypothetical protein